MSSEVISLTSSDEEDPCEPPAKKIKPTPILPECTLTIVNGKMKAKSRKEIDTVTLDSDDEITETKDNPKNLSVNNDKESSPKVVQNGQKHENNVDLISLIDDEDEIQPKIDQVNGILHSIFNPERANGIVNLENHFAKTNPDTVSIEDSDIEDEINHNDADIGKRTKNTMKLDKPEDKPENSDDSIIINDSDDAMEKENHCENESIERFKVNIERTSVNEVVPRVVPSPSKDQTAEARTMFKNFLRMVEEKIIDSSFEEIFPKKLPVIQKYFNRSNTYVNDKNFESLMRDSMTNIEKSTNSNGANIAVLSFHKIFEHLKSHVSHASVEIEEDDLPKVKKLEKTIKLLRKRIKQLEEAEVNFEDDEDSTYIQLDRYQSRLNKVYIKYCQYIKRNPYNGRATYDRISFVNSNYNEINLALTKKYKNSLVFPSYYELETFISKVVKKEKLNLNEHEVKLESRYYKFHILGEFGVLISFMILVFLLGRKCFKVLGNILQKKRKQELYDSHLAFIEFTEDPAMKDISLENVLRKNYLEGEEKIEKLCQIYATKQEMGEDKVSDETGSSRESEVEEKKESEI